MEKEVKVGNIAKKYENPMMELIHVACCYSSVIKLEKANSCVNAKSIMGIISFDLSEDDEVNVMIEGDDETEAMAAIEKFLSAV